MSGIDPWGFEAERADTFENPNWGPDASLCAQSFLSCVPKNVDYDGLYWWGEKGNQLLDDPSSKPRAVRSVTLPAAPYTGGALKGAAGGSGWRADVVWSPADAAAVKGTSYTATFTLTPSGRYYFDPENPPTVSVSGSGGSGGAVSSSSVDGNNEDGNVAVMTIVVSYGAVIDRPVVVTPPAGMFGYHGVINHSRQLSAVEGGTFETSDAIFDFIEAVTKTQAQSSWLVTPHLDEDEGGRPFYFLTQKPSDILDMGLTATTLSSFSQVNSVTVGGQSLTGYLWTAGPTTGVTLKAVF